MSWSLKPIAKFEGRKYRKKLLKFYIYIYIYTHTTN